MHIGDNIDHIVDPHEALLKSKKGYAGHSCCLMYKIKDGQVTDTPCIRVYVKKKRLLFGPEAVSQKDLIPPKIEGVDTDVVESDFQAQSWLWPFRKPNPQLFGPPGVYTQRQRPIRPGWSIGHYRVTAGTLGWFYWDKQQWWVVSSSNNHVVGNSNQAKEWDQILQPGKADKGRIDKDLIVWFHGMVPLTPDRDNYTDKAWGPLTNETGFYPAPEGYGPPRDKREAEVGLECLKVGRTTGKTKAVIFDASAYIQVGFSGLGDLWFRDVFLSHAQSQGGDSGSPAFTPDMAILGTLFAGSNAFTVFVKEKYTPSHLEPIGVI